MGGRKRHPPVAVIADVDPLLRTSIAIGVSQGHPIEQAAEDLDPVVLLAGGVADLAFARLAAISSA